MGNSRCTIAFLLDSLFDQFEEKIWTSALNMARKLDLNLVCFLAGTFRDHTSGSYDYKQTIYELLDKSNYDGIVAIMGSLSHYIKESEYMTILQRFEPLPVVSISKQIKNASNLLVDNKIGFRELMAHLIEAHHYQRIAFIRGPETSLDAEIRYHEYREVLAAYHIPFDPDLVVLESFLREDGVHAVQVLLDERKKTFDAIIGCNDYMAIYAMNELKRRNIRVPEDVAVAGFDDIQDATSVLPLLTTVNQPLAELGSQAIKTVLSMIKGAAPQDCVFPTRLVVRRSCGCTVHTEMQESLSLTINPMELKSSKALPAEAVARALESRFPELTEKLANPDWSLQLATVLFEEINGTKRGVFFDVLEGIIYQSIDKDLEISLWNKVVNTFLNLVDYYVKNDQEKKAFRQLQEEIYIFLSRITSSIQSALRARMNECFVVLYRAYHGLSTVFDEELTKQVMSEELPRLGINSFYLSFYEDGTRRGRAKLFFCYDLNQATAIIIDNSRINFPTHQLIPGSFRKDGPRFAYMVLPLHSKKEQLGFVLCEIGPTEGIVYETLITQISATIKGFQLMAEVKEYAEDLEKKVQERTAQLEETQHQLIETAHQAGMAEVSIGIVHNVGNLLNSVGISVEEIVQVLKKIKIDGLLKANYLLKSHEDDLPGFFASDPKAQLLVEYYWKAGQSINEDLIKLKEESLQLYKRTALMQEIVKSLQEYVYGNQSVAFNEKVNLEELIETALKIQDANIRKFKITVNRDYTKLAPIITQKNKLTHVLINLIKNAVEAMEANSSDERILSIKLMRAHKEKVIVEVGDTGEGIKEENLKKIFTYGFTTKKHGHGFGLHACANYMKEMGGDIYFNSKGPGDGTVFTLVIHDLTARESPCERLFNT